MANLNHGHHHGHRPRHDQGHISIPLRDLDAQLLSRATSSSPTSFHHGEVTLNEAQGVMFLCPRCYAANSGPIGTHSVICWFKDRVPDDLTPGPGRWIPSGTGIDDLTFTGPGAASIALESSGGGCGWHGFIRNGEAIL